MGRAPCYRRRTLHDDIGNGLKEEEYLAFKLYLGKPRARTFLLFSVGHHAADVAHLTIKGFRERSGQGHGPRMVARHATPGKYLKQIPLRTCSEEAQAKEEGNLNSMRQEPFRKVVPSIDARPEGASTALCGIACAPARSLRSFSSSDCQPLVSLLYTRSW
jgi:hypothetical protein